MRIPFGPGHYTSRSTNVNAQECINFFGQIDEKSRTIISLHGTPGVCDLATILANTVLRAAHVIGALLYVIADEKLYSVTTAYSVTELGDLNTSSGHVDMVDDGTYLAMADGTDGYTWHTGTLTFADITDAAFVGGGSMAFQDGYFISGNPAGNGFQWSTIGDPTSWDALDIQTVQGTTGNLVNTQSIKKRLWAFKANASEVYYNSGTSPVFQRIEGADLTHGLLSRGALTEADNTLYWINQDRWLVRDAGYVAKKLTPKGIDFQFESYSVVSDCFLYSYVEEGHTFIIVTFPSEGHTWAYDVSNDLWHKRQSYLSTGGQSRHRSNCYARFNGIHVIGDYEDGKIKQMDLDTYMDGTNLIRRVNAFPAITDTERHRRMKHRNMEIEIEYGAGLTTGQGSNPQIMMDYSDNGGHTFKNERWRSAGKIGEFEPLIRKVEWLRLGNPVVRNYRIAVTDPIKWIINGAYLNTL